MHDAQAAGDDHIAPFALLCWFHHDIAIHTWGWTVTVHPDATTTARSPDGIEILRSHGPPT